MKLPSGQYWAKRMRKLSDSLLGKGYACTRYLEDHYDSAIAELDKEISTWYRRFAANNEITYAEAKKLLASDELKEFRWSVEEYIRRGKQNALNGAWIKELENASARVHISRLDALKLQIRQRAEVLASEQRRGVRTLADDIYTTGYYHTAYELQKGVGVGWGLHGINQTILDKVLARSWTGDGRTFRDRCWANKDALVREVERLLPQMLIRGEAPDKTIREIAKRFGVAKSKAGRLVMTESAFFSSAAQQDCFKELGVERYKIVASFDSDTCDLCGALDGKIFRMSEYAIGVTAPPFHPWCRCCTAPYFDDMEGMGERFARGADGKKYSVPRDMTFEEWAKKQRPAQSADGSGGGRNQVERLGRVEPEREQVDALLDKYEEKWSGMNHEEAIIVASDGEVFHVVGDASSVDSRLLGERLRGAVDFHNHPDSKTYYSFSDKDVGYFLQMGQRESRAADSLYRYTMRRMEGTIDATSEAVEAEFRRIREGPVRELAWNGEIDIDVDEYHETVLRLAEKYHFEYERVKKDAGQ